HAPPREARHPSLRSPPSDLQSSRFLADRVQSPLAPLFAAAEQTRAPPPIRHKPQLAPPTIPLPPRVARKPTIEAPHQCPLPPTSHSRAKCAAARTTHTPPRAPPAASDIPVSAPSPLPLPCSSRTLSHPSAFGSDV